MTPDGTISDLNTNHNTVFTFTLPKNEISTWQNPIAEWLRSNEFQLDDGDGRVIVWRGRMLGCTITLYGSGKIVVQGAGAQDWATDLGKMIDALAVPYSVKGADGASRVGMAGQKQAPSQSLAGTPTSAGTKAAQAISVAQTPEEPSPYAAALAAHPLPLSDPWIGTDEAGKGDYFGPLVVAAAAVPRGMVEVLALLGVQDSKRLGDKRIRQIAPQLMATIPVNVVSIGPQRYNAIYPTIGNLNKLLAWGHARALENLLEDPRTEHCNYVLSDQFGDKSYLERALMKKGRLVRLDQRPKAEEDPAVACASIIARFTFITAMDRLSKRFDMEIPKGAGPKVLAAASALAKQHGEQVLLELAKTHFSTTVQVLGHPL